MSVRVFKSILNISRFEALNYPSYGLNSSATNYKCATYAEDEEPEGTAGHSLTTFRLAGFGRRELPFRWLIPRHLPQRSLKGVRELGCELVDDAEDGQTFLPRGRLQHASWDTVRCGPIWICPGETGSAALP